MKLKYIFNETNFKKYILVLAIFAFILITPVPSAGIGLFLKADKISGLDFLSETMQPNSFRTYFYVCMSYINGIQKMRIKFEAKDFCDFDDNILLIMPVNGSVDNVKVELSTGETELFPHGYATNNVRNIKEYLLPYFITAWANQIYPVFSLIPIDYILVCFPFAAYRVAAQPAHNQISRDVEIENIDKTVFNSQDDFSSYIIKKYKCKINEKFLKRFTPYLIKYKNFIIINISNARNGLNYSKWIDIEHSDNKIILLLKILEADIYRPTMCKIDIRGAYKFVETPKNMEFRDIYSSENQADSLRFAEDPEKMFYYATAKSEPGASLKFKADADIHTHISYSRDGGRYVSDMALEPIKSAAFEFGFTLSNLYQVYYPLSIFILFLFIVITTSYISGGLAGLAIFNKWNKYALIGISNTFTYPFFIYTVQHAGKNNQEILTKTCEIKIINRFFKLYCLIVAILRFMNPFSSYMFYKYIVKKVLPDINLYDIKPNFMFIFSFFYLSILTIEISLMINFSFVINMYKILFNNWLVF